MLQQIEQFRKLGEDFAMQHTDTEYLGELEEELQTAVLEAIPVEKRLRGLSPEDRMRGFSPEDRMREFSPEDRMREFSPEDRMRGLSPEDLLRRFTPAELAAGLSVEQAARLRELLEQKQGQ